MLGTKEEKKEQALFTIEQEMATNPALAEVLYGKTPEEKIQLYQDYTGRTAILGSELETANDTLSTAMPSVIQAGNTVVADPTALAQGLKNFQAGRERKRVKSDLRALSDDKGASASMVADAIGGLAQQRMTAQRLQQKEEEEENRTVGFPTSAGSTQYRRT